MTLSPKRAVDLQVFHYTLDVVARLGKRVDRIYLGVGRIATLRHPLFDRAAGGVMTRRTS